MSLSKKGHRIKSHASREANELLIYIKEHGPWLYIVVPGRGKEKNNKPQNVRHGAKSVMAFHRKSVVGGYAHIYTHMYI